MDNQLFTFITHHWPLCLAFFGVLILIFTNEHIMQKKGPKNLSPHAAVDAINHDKAKVIDMRDIEAFRQSHIVNAKNMPNATFEKLEKQKTSPFMTGSFFRKQN